ncbi:hypothetical protein [Pelovirga terrestris]|uniref:Uncharacterized protein n=1 Tax=Pelovirga terrestris TaxID=2771352 RepID=A0A8J6QT01_9BACT|nr:hypothetical protein [Pelovirga terrestris]MBD1401335.1 hypothetical protein [Pelovirga terrestris]
MKVDISFAILAFNNVINETTSFKLPGKWCSGRFHPEPEKYDRIKVKIDRVEIRTKSAGTRGDPAKRPQPQKKEFHHDGSI